MCVLHEEKMRVLTFMYSLWHILEGVTKHRDSCLERRKENEDN